VLLSASDGTSGETGTTAKKAQHKKREKEVPVSPEPSREREDSSRLGGTLGALPTKLALMHSRLIPQCKFNAITHTDLVVDDAEIIPNNMLAHAQLLPYFPVLETLGHQFDNIQLTRARPAVVFVNKYPSPQHFGREGP
jgi:hypothetical protein